MSGHSLVRRTGWYFRRDSDVRTSTDHGRFGKGVLPPLGTLRSVPVRTLDRGGRGT